MRTCMELLRPSMDLGTDVKHRIRLRKYECNDLVYAKQYFRNKWKWVSGTVRKRLDSVMYEIVTTEIRHLRSHINQLRSRVSDKQSSPFNVDESRSYRMLDVLLDAWGMNSNQSGASRQGNAEMNTDIARAQYTESPSLAISSSPPSSSSSSPLL